MIDVAILGATGTVGQKFVLLLQDHPLFAIKELVASPRSAGKKYQDACVWKQERDIPEDIAHHTIVSTDGDLESRLLFSGLDSTVAYTLEETYAKKGHTVISNSSPHRTGSHVPLVIPEINHEHLLAIKDQDFTRGATEGAIVTNPNCATMAIMLALAPLHQSFTISKMFVHTMQAISGAGYPGVASLDILGNVIPHIAGEQEKIETEPNKIFGHYTKDTGFVPSDITISAQCNRVPVIDGHIGNISLAFERTPTKDQIIGAWNNFRGFPQDSKLHSAPQNPVVYTSQANRPQPQLDVLREKGMATIVGQLAPCPLLDFKFTALGHNTIRGAAGAAILNAETMVAMGLFS